MKKDLMFSSLEIDCIEDQIHLAQKMDGFGEQFIGFHYLQWPLLHAEVMMAHPELAATCCLPHVAVSGEIEQHHIKAAINDDGYLTLLQDRIGESDTNLVILAPTQIKAMFELVMHDAALRCKRSAEATTHGHNAQRQDDRDPHSDVQANGGGDAGST